jgi:hypothetical protein
MVGPANARSNVVICSPGGGTLISQYVIISPESIQQQVVPGTTHMAVQQTATSTIMTWQRTVDDGNATDAQMSLSGPTNLIWAVGTTNVFGNDGAAMGSTAVFLGASTGSTTASLTNGLTLSWDVSGSTYTLRAVLNQLAW